MQLYAKVGPPGKCDETLMQHRAYDAAEHTLSGLGNKISALFCRNALSTVCESEARPFYAECMTARTKSKALLREGHIYKMPMVHAGQYSGASSRRNNDDAEGFPLIAEIDLIKLSEGDSADFNKFLARIATFFNDEGVVSFANDIFFGSQLAVSDPSDTTTTP